LVQHDRGVVRRERRVGVADRRIGRALPALALGARVVDPLLELLEGREQFLRRVLAAAEVLRDRGVVLHLRIVAPLRRDAVEHLTRLGQLRREVRRGLVGELDQLLGHRGALALEQRHANCAGADATAATRSAAAPATRARAATRVAPGVADLLRAATSRPQLLCGAPEQLLAALRRAEAGARPS